MPRATLSPAHNPGNPGSIGATRGGIGTLDFDAVDPMIGASINQVRVEVDDAYKDMQLFHQMEPDEIMRRSGGHSARLSYLRVCCMRVEDFKREWRDIRTRELEPTLDQLEHQFSIASRLHSVREYDYKLEAGER